MVLLSLGLTAALGLALFRVRHWKVRAQGLEQELRRVRSIVGATKTESTLQSVRRLLGSARSGSDKRVWS